MATVDEWLAGVTQDGQQLDPVRVARMRERHLPVRSVSVAPNPPRQTPQKRGWGDAVSSALSVVGITEERVSAWIGADCGCAERREKLNKLGFWAERVLAGHHEPPPIP